VTRSSERASGGSGDLRRRVLRHHLPLALASAIATFLWMGLAFSGPPPSMGAAQHSPAPAQATNAPTQATQAPGHQMPPEIAGAAGHGPRIAAPTAHPMPRTEQAAGTPAHGGQGTRGADLGGMVSVLQDRGFMSRFTTASGYVALGLLAITLLIGPANLLLRRRVPVSSYLRRDVGAWTAIVSVVHVVAGLQVHGPPGEPVERVLRYFFAADGTPLTDSFGLGNWTGLAATVIVLALLAISNDLALRAIKAKRWKWLQRLNYALFALVVAHAIYYGALLRVTSLSTLALGVTVVVVFVGQAIGFRLWRRRRARAAASGAAA